MTPFVREVAKINFRRRPGELRMARMPNGELALVRDEGNGRVRVLSRHAASEPPRPSLDGYGTCRHCGATVPAELLEEPPAGHPSMAVRIRYTHRPSCPWAWRVAHGEDTPSQIGGES
jgi:hypothetical protein